MDILFFSGVEVWFINEKVFLFFFSPFDHYSWKSLFLIHLNDGKFHYKVLIVENKKETKEDK